MIIYLIYTMNLLDTINITGLDDTVFPQRFVTTQTQNPLLLSIALTIVKVAPVSLVIGYALCLHWYVKFTIPTPLAIAVNVTLLVTSTQRLDDTTVTSSKPAIYETLTQGLSYTGSNKICINRTLIIKAWQDNNFGIFGLIYQ